MSYIDSEYERMRRKRREFYGLPIYREILPFEPVPMPGSLADPKRMEEMTEARMKVVREQASVQKVMFMGRSLCGKSFLISRWITGKLPTKYEAMHEHVLLRHRPRYVFRDHRVDVEVYEIGRSYPAGRLELDRFRAEICHCEAFVICMDLDGNNPLKNAEQVHDEVVRMKHGAAGNTFVQGTDVPIVLVGTKADQKNPEKVPPKDLEDLLEKWEHRVPYIETSGQNNTNVHKVFDTVLELLYQHKKQQFLRRGYGHVHNFQKKASIRVRADELAKRLMPGAHQWTREKFPSLSVKKA